MIDQDALLKRLRDVVGPEHATSAPETCAVDGMSPGVAASPADADQVAALLKRADGMGAAVVPWGGGTDQRLGNLPARMDVALRNGPTHGQERCTTMGTGAGGQPKTSPRDWIYPS